jgi:hypothetical protein
VLLVVAFGSYYPNVAQAEQAVRDNPQDGEKRLALAET